MVRVGCGLTSRHWVRCFKNILQIIEQGEENPVEGMPPNIGQEQPLQQAMPSSNVEGFSYDDRDNPRKASS